MAMQVVAGGEGGAGRWVRGWKQCGCYEPLGLRRRQEAPVNMRRGNDDSLHQILTSARRALAPEPYTVCPGGKTHDPSTLPKNLIREP